VPDRGLTLVILGQVGLTLTLSGELLEPVLVLFLLLLRGENLGEPSGERPASPGVEDGPATELGREVDRRNGKRIAHYAALLADSRLRCTLALRHVEHSLTMARRAR
jgi:hypothetical protein